MNRILRYALPFFMIFLIVGSSTANVINYSEVNETVEYDVANYIGYVNESCVNTHNDTYDRVYVVNETIRNDTHEEEQQVWIANTTNYTRGNVTFSGADVDRVVMANGTVRTFTNGAIITPVSPSASLEKYDATLYLRNGTVIDIAISREGITPRYWLREIVPVYDTQVVNVTDIVNRITTYIVHITDIYYEYVEPVEPVDPVEPVNNTTDVEPVIEDNTTTEPANDEVGIPMETTGNGIALGFAAILLIVVALVLVARRD